VSSWYSAGVPREPSFARRTSVIGSREEARFGFSFGYGFPTRRLSLGGLVVGQAAFLPTTHNP